jgi:hypothetical protein
MSLIPVIIIVCEASTVVPPITVVEIVNEPEPE